VSASAETFNSVENIPDDAQARTSSEKTVNNPSFIFICEAILLPPSLWINAKKIDPLHQFTYSLLPDMCAMSHMAAPSEIIFATRCKRTF
jgi:hypothetical protein